MLLKGPRRDRRRCSRHATHALIMQTDGPSAPKIKPHESLKAFGQHVYCHASALTWQTGRARAAAGHCGDGEAGA